MELVAFIGKDAENWGQVTALMKRMEYDKAIIIKDKTSGVFPTNPKTQIVNVDVEKPLIELKEDILKVMRDKLSGDFEVALSIASGNGKEHMAVISALLSVPVGIRLVVFTKEGVKYIN